MQLNQNYNNMAYILALETSSTICSVALFKNEQLLGISELQIEKSHSSHITVLTEQLLYNCQVSFKELSAIALSGGPGSYTGLRIGSSTAKGLCYALDIPLISVSTLHALTATAIDNTPQANNYLFCPMIDARRLEVYSCLLDHNLNEVEPIKPVLLEETTFAEYLANNRIVFFGSGAPKFKALTTENQAALFLNHVVPTARSMGQLALAKFQSGDFENVAYYEPFYLKEVYITKSNKQNK
jgi:tRNA threonylcarbamoyladenosine biosynthesis protein TsaB